jgi:hypothetical protein
MHASSCVGRYDGQWHEGDHHGRGVYTSARGGWTYDGQWHEGDCHGRGVFTSVQRDWTYSGALERDRPTEGELVEADGRRFKVAYAKDCAFIYSNPSPKTKVGVVCGAAAEELPAVRTRACEAAVMCALFDAFVSCCDIAASGSVSYIALCRFIDNREGTNESE